VDFHHSSIFSLNTAQNFLQHTFKEPFDAIAHANWCNAVPVIDILHQTAHLGDQSADLLVGLPLEHNVLWRRREFRLSVC
jgi:hypothetical protein